MEPEKNTLDEQPTATEAPEVTPNASDWTEPSADSAEAAQQFTEFPLVESKTRENVLAGFVGAFLFALIGGVLYFLIYQTGIIAGICGLITFILANFGYGLLSGNRKGESIPGLVASIIMMLLIIFLAEYICIAYEIYRALAATKPSFINILRLMPEFLSDKDIFGAFVHDLVFAYLLGLFASIGNITRMVKSRKQSII